MPSNVAYLRITTWKESLSYASHYYGRIDLNDKSPDIDVRKRLTEAEAKDLWKVDKRRGEKKYLWKEGDSCGAFLSEKALIDAAKKLLPDHIKVLILGEPYTLSVQRVAYAKKEYVWLKNRANKLYKRAEEVDWYDGDKEQQKVMAFIDREWEDMLEGLKKNE